MSVRITVCGRYQPEKQSPSTKICVGIKKYDRKVFVYIKQKKRDLRFIFKYFFIEIKIDK